MECGKYTKYSNGLCKACFDSKNAKEKLSKNEKNTNGFPSHTDFYRDLHIIEDYFIEYMVHQINKKRLFSINDEYRYSIGIEDDSWDIIINIDTISEDDISTLEDIGNDYLYNSGLNKIRNEILGKEFFVYCEYKSSINEWGKQIDQFFRQIKNKAKMQKIKGNYCLVLLSFDEQFEDYQEACKMAGIELIILPKVLLYVLQGENKEERLNRMKQVINDSKRGTKLLKEQLIKEYKRKYMDEPTEEGLRKFSESRNKSNKKYNCNVCGRGINHKGNCLPCNKILKKEKSE